LAGFQKKEVLRQKVETALASGAKRFSFFLPL
jgi:hypothetical protein